LHQLASQHLGFVADITQVYDRLAALVGHLAHSPGHGRYVGPRGLREIGHVAHLLFGLPEIEGPAQFPLQLGPDLFGCSDGFFALEQNFEGVA